MGTIEQGESNLSPTLQEATKQFREALVPAVLQVPSQRVGILIIQRPSDPLDVLLLDIELRSSYLLSEHTRIPDGGVGWRIRGGGRA